MDTGFRRARTAGEWLRLLRTISRRAGERRELILAGENTRKIRRDSARDEFLLREAEASLRCGGLGGQHEYLSFGKVVEGPRWSRSSITRADLACQSTARTKST